MNVYFYRAECGDAARVHFRGNDGKRHNIFIDSGYERTFELILRQEISKIKTRGDRIDMWLISHIHDDHIGGAVAYLKAIKTGELPDIVDSWIYNPPRPAGLQINGRQTSPLQTLSSIEQGDGLTGYLSDHGKIPQSDITSKFPVQDLFGLKLTMLAPQPTQLGKLRDKYAPGRVRSLQRIEPEPEEAARQFDYHIPLGEFDPEEWNEDDSVENGSSISLLMDAGGKKILWLADSLPGSIIRSLKKLGYSKTNPLVCDWVKVTHHGSKGNNSLDLYDMIRCNNYLISADGRNKHCLPTKECLARILRSRFRPLDSRYFLVFTYNNKVLRKIFDVDGPGVFDQYNFQVKYSDRKWIRV
ncbi:MBL fold metallo-hydrolase [Flavihumibacter sp. R14]|nr:MBL fold metallo-hydrolase [Flavihumibacter soli]